MQRHWPKRPIRTESTSSSTTCGGPSTEAAIAAITRRGLGHTAPRVRLVIVQGPRLAGGTSTLAQAAQTYLASHRLLAYVDDPRITVPQMVAQGRRWADTGPGAVLWIDDLTPARLGQLDRALLDGLPSGLWILATVHDKHLRGFRTPEHVRLLLEESAVVVRLGTISGREREALRAERTYAALQPALDSVTSC